MDSLLQNVTVLKYQHEDFSELTYVETVWYG